MNIEVASNKGAKEILEILKEELYIFSFIKIPFKYANMIHINGENIKK